MFCNCKDEDMVSLDYSQHKENFEVKSTINYDSIPNSDDFFNHMITLIYEDHGINNSYYLYDITNRFAFNIENSNKAILVAGKGEACINPILSYQCSLTNEGKRVLEDFIVCNSYNKVIDNVDFLKKYDAMNEKCKENKDIFEENFLFTKGYLVNITEACSRPKILKLKGE